MSYVLKKGLIPDAFRDELLTRVDLIDLIDSYIPLKKKGQNASCCCPFHQEKTPSFHVNAKKQFYHCFGCGVSGNAVSFIMHYLNQSYPEAIDTLAVRVGMVVPKDANKAAKYPMNMPLYTLMQRVNTFYQNILGVSKEVQFYLESRGISHEIAKHFQVGYAPNAWHSLAEAFRSQTADLIKTGMLINKENGRTFDRYRHRLMFPIHDRKGRIIGFGGRVIRGEDTPKYLNSPETLLFQKSKELYGLYQTIEAASSGKVDKILITEGYLDVISLFQYGLPYAVATMGTSTSYWHIQALLKYTHHLVFCFDGDVAGKRAAWRALEQVLGHLSQDVVVSFVFLQEGEDPDSYVRKYGKEGFLAVLETAIPLERYLFDVLTEGLSLAEVSGRNALIYKAEPFLKKVPKGAYREFLLQELAMRARIEIYRLQALYCQTTIADKKLVSSPRRLVKTPTRQLLSLLIQQPENVSEFEDLSHLGSLLYADEVSWFKPVWLYLVAHPQVTTGVLLEHFRDAPFFDDLCELATWDYLLPQETAKESIQHLVCTLQKKNREASIHVLLKKSREVGLTVSEQQQLQILLREKHQLNSLGTVDE